MEVVKPLSKITTPIKFNRLVVWDIETTPDMEPFLVGARCGESDQQTMQFEGSECIKEFVEFVLEDSDKHWGTIYFAHNGGGFDHLYVLYEILDRQRGRFTVMPVLSGGSVILMFVTEISTGRRLFFSDSIRLLNMSLKKIGEAIGEARKSDMDFNTPATDPRWKTYNNQDTLVLWQAIDKLEEALVALGGELKVTAASSAMALFQRRYLKLHIQSYREHHSFYRSCYFGGRTEIFDLRRRTNVKLFDINSLYPYACTKYLPFALDEKIDQKFLCDDVLLFENFRDPTQAYFVECLVEVPDTVKVGPLPVRTKNGLMYPVGRFWGNWADPDLRNLLLCGGQILKVKRAHKFRCAQFACSMMNDLYEARQNKDKPAMALAAKLMMNSWYGKTGQRPIKDKIYFHPRAGDLQEDYEWICKDPEREYWVSTFEGNDPHILPFIAAYVTATARSIHYPYLLNSNDPIYCDTDCVVTSDNVATGTELGAMKLEADFAWFQAYLPKLYHGQLTDGEMKNRAKGFGGWNKEIFELGVVDHLSKGGAVNVKGPMKFRSLLNGGDLKPREKSSMKQVRSVYDKRIVLPDRTTKPHRIWEE